MMSDDLVLLWTYARERWATFSVPRDERLQRAKAQAWQDALGDLTIEQIHVAMVSLGTSDHVPPLGTIRCRALELTAEAEGEGSIPDHDQAWAEVMAGVRRFGRRQRPSFSHPLVTEVVMGMGWIAICDSDNLGVTRGQFRMALQAARERFMTERFPAPALAAFAAQHALSQSERPELPVRSDEQG